MTIELFFVEIILSNNDLLYTFPMMLFFIPLAFGIYSFLTFVPKWIVDNKLKENKKKVIFLTILWIIIAIGNYITQVNLQ